MTLTQAIDALFDFVDNHWKTPDYGDGLEELNALDQAVYVAARRDGLQDALPRQDATFHSDEVVFFGRTNVPGAWNSPPDAPSTLTLMSTQGWKADLFALRTLDDPGDDKPKEGEPEETERSATLNERMAAMFQTNPNYVKWPARKWATKYSVSDSAVKQTDTWKLIMKTRSMYKVERAERGK